MKRCRLTPVATCWTSAGNSWRRGPRSARKESRLAATSRRFEPRRARERRPQAGGNRPRGYTSATAKGAADMQRNHIGPLTGLQLARLVAILEAYRAEPLNPAIVALAARVARLEVRP